MWLPYELTQAGQPSKGSPVCFCMHWHCWGLKSSDCVSSWPHLPQLPPSFGAEGQELWCRRGGRSSGPHLHFVSFALAVLLGCPCSWELLPAVAVIRWGCMLRLSKGQPRWIEFQSTWLVLFEVAGNCSAFVSLSASEMEPHVFQKCCTPLPRPYKYLSRAAAFQEGVLV